MKDFQDTRIERTGPYTHVEGMRTEARFASESHVDRSFSLVVATGHSRHPEDRGYAGIAVLDNDHGRVVVDGLRPVRGDEPDGPAMQVAMHAMGGMSWTAFRDMCRTSDRYRGGIPDIDEGRDIPLPGNSARQVSMNLLSAVPEDLRPGLLRQMDADPDLPYQFPAMTRDDMAADILSRPRVEIDGREAIGWTLEPHTWNRTGRLPGGAEVDAEYDQDWRRAVEASPSIVNRAIRNTVAPYADQPFDVLEMGPAARCEMTFLDESGAPMALTGFAGGNATVRDHDDMAARLDAMNDSELAHLWAAIRVLDADLDPEVLKDDFAQELHEIRLAYDADPIDLDEVSLEPA